MSCPTPPTTEPKLRRYFKEPWTAEARKSPALRKWCARHGYLTPNFAVHEMADTGTGKLPAPLRPAARRHCFNLERFKHELGGVAIHIDGPTRTLLHNRRVGGARLSRHLFGDATDLFLATVDRIVAASPKVKTRMEVVAIAEKIFPGVGNETSGTLHLDSRLGPWVRFVTWVAGR